MAPTTIQPSVRTRSHMSVARTDMNAREGDPQPHDGVDVAPGRAALEQPVAGRVHRQRQGEVGDEGHEHRPGQPGAVARADEHAVDDEDEARERLAERHDDEAAGDGRLHLRRRG